jgi:hypothetical protein
VTPGAVRRPASVLVLFALLAVALHVRSFYAEHAEGDERVYLALARDMGWDVSGYTTRADPVVSRYPYSIYRQELFHQPPLLPLVLKAGMLFGAPVAAGLAFQVLAVLLLLGFARRAAAVFALPVPLQVALFAALVACPLLTFSTTRLHHDGLLGIFLFCALILHVDSLEEGSTRKAIGAGLLYAAALNVRYNALAALPLPLLVHALHLYRHAGAADPAAGPDSTRAAGPDSTSAAAWRNLAIVGLVAAVLGLPHYARVLAAYGSLLPSSFLAPDADVAQWNEFLRRVHTRTRLRSALELFAIYPMLLTWLAPASLRAFRAQLRARSPACVVPLAAALLVAVHLVALHQQLRYFAVATPLVLLGFVLQIHAADAAARESLWRWAGASFALMAIGAVHAVFTPQAANVVPAVFALLPFLQPFAR